MKQTPAAVALIVLMAPLSTETAAVRVLMIRKLKSGQYPL
jgi:hypothetical protein